jgi:16S rRNA (cytosine1402-N4)-methyltransferase
MFELNGEVTNSRTLAKTIVAIRQSVPIRTISNFKNAVEALVKGNPHKYLAQVFQAVRIEVNDELGSLRAMLMQVPLTLKTGGRICIITFHSLEDRIVKNYFKRGGFEAEENLYHQTQHVHLLKPVTKKPVIPGEKEIKINSRARSAKLRIAERM